jgi:hypothetical protein
MRAAASRSAVPVAKVASAAATSPLRFSIKGVAEIGEPALQPGPFAVKTRVLVGRRGVRRVRPLGLAKIGLAVAPRRRRLPEPRESCGNSKNQSPPADFFSSLLVRYAS